jgi:Protein of unknown function (DUF3800)
LGILYLDEAGNTGLKDTAQPYLLYGGPLVGADKWKALEHDFIQVQKKYYALIFSRIDQISDPTKIGAVVSQLKFLENFHFHASRIVNRMSLWSKLDETKGEHFDVLKDLVTLINKHQIDFFAGAIDKSTVQGQSKNKPEFRQLLPAFFKHVDDNANNNHFMVIWDDGDTKDREIILDGLKRSNLKNCIPELVSAKQLPMLQLADVGLWIIQYYLKLDAARTDDFAQNVRSLYNQISPNLKLLKIGF